jgi:hypothetical protein
MMEILYSIFDDRPFEFDRKEYEAMDADAEKGDERAIIELDKFSQSRWNVLRKVDPKRKRPVITDAFLEELDEIFIRLFEYDDSSDGFELTDLIGTHEKAWIGKISQYMNEVREIILGYAESIEATRARVVKKLDWILNEHYSRRGLLPFPTRSVIRALANGFGKTPEALKEVSVQLLRRETRALVMRTVFVARD